MRQYLHRDVSIDGCAHGYEQLIVRLVRTEAHGQRQGGPGWQRDVLAVAQLAVWLRIAFGVATNLRLRVAFAKRSEDRLANGRRELDLCALGRRIQVSRKALTIHIEALARTRAKKFADGLLLG